MPSTGDRVKAEQDQAPRAGHEAAPAASTVVLLLRAGAAAVQEPSCGGSVLSAQPH